MYRNLSKKLNFQNFIDYKKIDAQTKKILKYKKRFSWKKFASELNKDTPTTVIWNKIKLFKNINSSPCSKKDDILEEV